MSKLQPGDVIHLNGSSEKPHQKRLRGLFYVLIYHAICWIESDAFLPCLILFGALLSAAAWGSSVAGSARAGHWLMLLVDFVAFPAGIVDGLGMWLRIW